LVGENVERQGGREGRLVRREERRQGGRERREGRERGRGVVRTRGPCVGGPCRRLRSRGPARSRRIHNLLPRCCVFFLRKEKGGEKEGEEVDAERRKRSSNSKSTPLSTTPSLPSPLRTWVPAASAVPRPPPSAPWPPPLVVSVLVHQLIQLALDFLHVRALNAATLLLTPVDEQN